MKRMLLAVGDTATTLQTAHQIRPWLNERETSLTLLSVATSTLDFPAKKTLEQTEAIFTQAVEKPGILLRINSDPAAEIERQVRQGGYDLLVVGLRSQPIDITCRALLRAYPAPMFISPANLQSDMTSQILVIIDGPRPLPKMMDWLIAQCQTQQLNIILCARAVQDAIPWRVALEQTRIRTQIIIRTPLSPNHIYLLSRDRRVRWIVLPVEVNQYAALHTYIDNLLCKVNCPVLLTP